MTTGPLYLRYRELSVLLNQSLKDHSFGFLKFNFHLGVTVIFLYTKVWIKKNKGIDCMSPTFYEILSSVEIHLRISVLIHESNL